MKFRNTILLVIAAIALIYLAISTSKKEKQEVAAAIVSGQLLFPDLQLDAIEKIVVTTADSTATLAKVNDTWVSVERYNYPVNFQKIKDALIRLSEIKISQKFDVTESQRDNLRMQTPSAAATNKAVCGSLIQFTDRDNKAIASLLIGSTRERKAPAGSQFGGYPDGQFVSTDGGRTALLIGETLESMSASPKEWIDTELLNVSLTDIREMSITGTNRAPVKLARRQDSATYELEGLGAEEEIDLAKQNGLEGALSSLRFSDVADPAVFTDLIAGLDKPVIYRAVTAKGEVYTVKLGSTTSTNSHDRYARMSAEYIEPAADTNAVAATNVVNAAVEKQALRDKIKTLNDSLSKWTFILDSYKADAMTVQRSELVKPKAKPEAKGTDKKEARVDSKSAAMPETKPNTDTNAPASQSGKTDQKKGFWKSLWPF